MPANLDELIEEITIINDQLDKQSVNEKFLLELNENGRDRFTNIHIAFKDMETRFSNAQSYLVPDSKVNTSNINNSITWINNGLSSPNNYNNYVSNDTHNFHKGFVFLANLASVMPLPIAESSERLKDAARSLSGSVGQYQRRYEEGIAELETKKESLDEVIVKLDERKLLIEREWNELESNINEKQKTLDQQYSQLQTDFINNQSERSTDFENLKREISEEKTNLIEQMKKEFEEEKVTYFDTITGEKDELLETWNDRLEKWYEGIISEYNEWKNDISEDSDEIIGDLRQKQKEAADMVGNITHNSIAGHFAEEAKAKSKSVKKWRNFTIGSFLLTVLGAVLLLIVQYGNDAMSVTEFSSRLVVTAALGSLTAYLGKLAANDEKSRKYNSSMEIRLRTLNPYLESFDPEDQVRLKRELFPIIFRETEEEYQTENNQSSLNKDEE